MNELQITTHKDGVRLKVRVMPRASKSGLGGVRNGCLVVRVTAPPVEGAANAAVIEVIAKAVGVPKRAVSLVTGDTHREKTIAIAGVTAEVVRSRLAPNAA